MFIAVIVLLNLLVAIIVDMYAMVRHDAEASFWTKRLLFITDVNQMQKLPKFITKLICCRIKTYSSNQSTLESHISSEHEHHDAYYKNWEAALAYFEDKSTLHENGVSVSKYCANFFPRCAFIFIIPSWIVLGFLSAGILWPPQVREMLFFASGEKTKERISEDQDNTATITQLRDEALVANQTMFTMFSTINSKMDQVMSDLELKNVEIEQLKSNLQHINKMNNEISDMKSDIHSIKEMLFCLQAHIEKQ